MNKAVYKACTRVETLKNLRSFGDISERNEKHTADGFGLTWLLGILLAQAPPVALTAKKAAAE